MDILCKSQTISVGVKLRLLRSTEDIVLPVTDANPGHGNEEIVKTINAFVFKCYRRLLGISWRYRRPNESVKEQVEDLAGVQKPLIQIALE